MDKNIINREYKDRLFRFLFGETERKENLLSLYNALNETHYTDKEELQIKTIEDVIYMGMKNDVAFLLHNKLSLYEQQSTYNPNMPIRGMMYAAKAYQRFIEEGGYNIYGTKLIKLPVPQYVVFYNGKKELPDEMVMKLSDSFDMKDVSEGYEWTARMLNINLGRNKKLTDACNTLKEYTVFVAKINEKVARKTALEQAVDESVEECIREHILEEFLVGHRAEVKDMCLTEYNEEEVLNAFREEAREEGLREGVLRGTIEIAREYGASDEKIICNLVEKFNFTQEEAIVALQEYAKEQSEEIE